MAGDKATMEVQINPDQVSFLKQVRESYDLPDESKALRVILDYIQINQDIHEAVFGTPRCLRCD